MDMRRRRRDEKEEDEVLFYDVNSGRLHVEGATAEQLLLPVRIAETHRLRISMSIVFH